MVDITRERLFELVWNEPATAVAKRLGISDAALGKLCGRLQVPKPPRGYWVRKQAGRRVRRPPLPAFVEASHRRSPQTVTSRHGGAPRLSSRKRELFDYAVRQLRKDGPKADDFIVSAGRLTSIDPDFAAAVLVAVGQNYRRWFLPEGGSRHAEQGLEGAATRLVEDLLPLAREQVLVFSPPQPKDDRRHRTPDQHAVVRFTPELVGRVARLANLVRDEGMAFAAHDLGSDSQFWRVRWAYDPVRAVSGQTRLCVSATKAWIRYDGGDWLGEPRVLDTAAVPLDQIVSVELLGLRAVKTAQVHARTHQPPFKSRLQALQQAEQAFDIAESAWTGADREVEPERLTRALALWWTDEQLEALQRVRRGLEDLGPWMERWEEALDHERAALCRAVLGVRIGDSVSVPVRHGRTRLQLQGVRLLFREDQGELEFLLYGARYRKDGLPGKRAETATINVPWTSE